MMRIPGFIFAAFAAAVLTLSCSKESGDVPGSPGRREMISFSVGIRQGEEDNKAVIQRTGAKEWRMTFDHDSILVRASDTGGTELSSAKFKNYNDDGPLSADGFVFNGEWTYPEVDAAYSVFYPSSLGEEGTLDLRHQEPENSSAESDPGRYYALRGDTEKVTAGEFPEEIVLKPVTALLQIFLNEGTPPVEILAKDSKGRYVTGIDSEGNAISSSDNSPEDAVLFSSKGLDSGSGNYPQVYLIVVPAGEKLSFYNGSEALKTTRDSGLKAGSLASLYIGEKSGIIDTNLPVLYIDTPGSVAVNSKEIWTEGARIRLLKADGTEDYASDALSIRGRGNTSWSFPKKPYALKLGKKAKLLGMPAHKRWCLLSNWVDRTLIRNDIAFHTAALTGLAWTPRGEFVELVMNGEHVGNYYLCEQIRVGKDRVNITEMTADDEDGDALTGGYLLEIDSHFDEVNKFHSAIREMPYMIKSPDDDVLTSAQFAYIENYINSFEKALYDDDAFARGDWIDIIDLQSFADWWIVYSLIGNPEPSHPKSCYLYKDRGGKLTAGPPWDFDLSFLPSIDLSEAVYYDRLFQSTTFKSVLKERWETLKPAFDTIPDYIQDEAKRLEASNALNIKMWPIDNGWMADYCYSYEDAIALLIGVFRNNYRFIDEKLAALMPE